MAQYNRQSTFLPDEVLTAEQLEDEFNAIQAAINDIDSRVGNVEGGGLIVYNAADPEFAPLGSESNAARVANAIQAALAGDARSKVVWVPKSMWGYSADPDFSLAMFDPAVLVVREGSLKPWYDPVAYGVDLTGTRKADDIIQLCIDHAAQAVGPGSRVVAFTVPGDYMLDSDVTHNSGVGIIVLPGVNFTGDSEFTDDPAWKFPADPPEGYSYDADGANAGERLATTRQIGRIIPLFVQGTTDNDGKIFVDLSDFGDYDNTKVIACATANHGIIVNQVPEPDEVAARVVVNITSPESPQTTTWEFRVLVDVSGQWAPIVSSAVAFHAVFYMESP